MHSIAIACYKAHSGKEKELEAIVHAHVPTLQSLGFATQREPIVMYAEDGTIVEIFEWTSQEAVEAAHKHPEVMKLWGEYAECCDYLTLQDIAEHRTMFPHFKPFSYHT